MRWNYFFAPSLIKCDGFVDSGQIGIRFYVEYARYSPDNQREEFIEGFIFASVWNSPKTVGKISPAAKII